MQLSYATASEKSMVNAGRRSEKAEHGRGTIPLKPKSWLVTKQKVQTGLRQGICDWQPLIGSKWYSSLEAWTPKPRLDSCNKLMFASWLCCFG